MSDLPPTPTLYHRYIGHIYRIKIMPRGIEVERLATGTTHAAKRISFEPVSGLHLGHSWNSSLAEKLIDRYEKQLIADQDTKP